MAITIVSIRWRICVRTRLLAFQAAGGKGSFREFTPPDSVNGHSISSFPALWGETVAGYLTERGL